MFGFGVKSITTTELAERLSAGKPLLIDVREPYEYKAGHIKQARNIPLGSLQSGAAKLPKDAEIYVICQSGSRSVTGTRMLKQMGFSDVTNVKGGTSAWRGKLAK